MNTLIHADYSGRVSILVTKRPDMFNFRNPGLMRVPIEQALQGGDSDCRNRNLQDMFRHVGAGEQAGSGIPKIYQNWNKQHWRKPRIIEKREPEQTIFELHMISLLPSEVVERLDRELGEKFSKLPRLERIILVTAATEHVVDHKRICEIVKEHPADISKSLKNLTKKGFLRTNGARRGTSYYVPGFGLIPSSPDLEVSSPDLEVSSPDLEVKKLMTSNLAQSKRRLDKTQMEDIILNLCSIEPQSIGKLAKLLDREPNFIRDYYLKLMVKSHKLELLYPDIPHHPQQAYLTPSLRTEFTKQP